jgi:hypothetical protein
MTFDNVTSGGDANVDISGQGTPPPIGFRVGSPPVYYEITTTAVFTGEIEICIDYTGVTFTNNDNPNGNIELFHQSATGWEQITMTIDSVNHTVCGRTTSLSPFVIAEVNSKPVIEQITTAIDPVQVNTDVDITVSFSDADITDTHTVVFNWGDGTSDTVLSSSASGTAQAQHAYSTPGVYVVTAEITDNNVGVHSLEYRYVVVYDPSGGFVTGGGWIDSPSGAYYPEPELTGKANFGFVSKYKKGTTTPTGDTEFRFKAADLDFRSSDYEWLVLVVAGSKGQFKGVGTINGEGAYNFILTAIDGDLNGNDNFEADRFRMRIWSEDELANEHAVYDNGFDADNFDDENLTSTTTELGGGSIVIHQVKGNN